MSDLRQSYAVSADGQRFLLIRHVAPAFADVRGDFVDTETGAGCQGQTAWIIPATPRGRDYSSRRYTATPTAYAALIAELSQNSWKWVTLPLRNVNTIAKSESKPFLVGVVAL